MAKYNIIIEGDSIPFGVYVDPTETMPYQLNMRLQALGDGNIYTVTNVSESGRTMSQMYMRYASSVAALYDPTADFNYYIVWGGGNDIYYNPGQLALTIAYFDLLASAVIATGFSPFAMNLIQRGNGGNQSVEMWRSEATIINNHLASHQNVTLINIKSLYPSYDWEIDPWLSSGVSVRDQFVDDKHPSASAHAKEAIFVGVALGLLPPPTSPLKTLSGQQITATTLTGQTVNFKTFANGAWQ